ncbi:MAG: class I SAM-dependent methyltransferase [Candidatus Methylomirabilales bacterium]
MHRLFESHIRWLLDVRRPKSLLEVGVLRGANTLKLLEWCAQNGASLTSLDPLGWEGNLPDEIKQPFEGYKYKRGQKQFADMVVVPEYLEIVYRQGLDQHWICLKMRSLEYLQSPSFAGFDMYLIDGDHNYFTVSNELRLIHEKGKIGDVLLFNDVVGRWARQDLYYDPTFIPNEYRGGPRQGVLTAIEDFLDSLSRRRLWWRLDCPYRFKIVTRRHDGLGLLERVRPANEA